MNSMDCLLSIQAFYPAIRYFLGGQDQGQARIRARDRIRGGARLGDYMEQYCEEVADATCQDEKVPN